MRIRLPLGRSLFFGCVFLVALLALLPLRLVLGWLDLDARGFAAREARGSVWLGALSEAQLGPVALGDLDARLNPLPLLVGRARFDLARRDEGDLFAGAVVVTRHGFAIDGLTGKLDAGAAFGPLPIASLSAEGVSVAFADGLCASAEGAVTANIAGDVGGLTLPPSLTGNARCDQGALLLPLASQSGMESVDMRLSADGGYTISLAVRPSDDAMRDRLTAAGFALGSSGYVLSAEGTF